MIGDCRLEIADWGLGGGEVGEWHPGGECLGARTVRSFEPRALASGLGVHFG